MYFEALASGGGSDWYFTILMKAPLGAAITVDDGDEEVEATGAGMDNLIGIPVHNPSSTYTISVKMNGLTAPTSNITTPATSGGISSVVEVPFAKISLTYEDNFRGQALSVSDGTHTASPSPVMPALGNSLDIYVPYTGDWTLEATDPVSGDQFNSSPNPVSVSSLDQTINAGLFVIPDGKTVLPVNDIQLWLACADIKDKTYTTLTEVLADEATLRKLMTDDNAIDYMVRSKQFINKGLVPTMTSNTTPTGTGSVFSNPVGKDVDHEFCVFDNDSTTRYNTENGTTTAYVGFNFDVPTRVNRFRITEFTSGMNVSNGATNQFVLEYSDDDITYTPVGTYEILAANIKDTLYFDNSSNVVAKYWRVRFLGITYTSSSYTCVICNDIQFYPYTSSIVEDETAMSYIGAYDYAADTLLSDADWCQAIAESSYVDSVLNVKVPAMTSNTAPSGICSASSKWDSNYEPYLPFNGTGNGLWHAASGTMDGWLQYQFDSAVKIYASLYKSPHANRLTGGYKVKGSKNGTDFVELTEQINHPDNNAKDYQRFTKNIDNYTYYRFDFPSANSQPTCNEAQFYGRQAAGVQTLLKAAGVDRPYTTLDELFADKEVLAMVISSHEAIDYLVTVKDWIDEFTSDETAMLFIGSDNYAADTLLADSDWGYAIALSSYKESVLNVFPPKMTSDTTPEGKCFASSNYSGYSPWFAFGNGTYNCWSPANGTNQYVGYIFPNPTVIKYATFTWDVLSRVSGGITIEASLDTTNGNDGTWVTLASFNPTKLSDAYPLNNNTAYIGYRVKITGTSVAVYYNGDHHFYGREDVTEGVHIFSAASDTIYDQNNNVIATTDTSGHALISKSLLPNGTYTLRSTVAKDPDNLSNDFTKVVEVTDATKAIMVMPDNALYWYGYKLSCEQLNAANGWTLNYGGMTHTGGGVTFNALDVSLHGYATSSGTTAGIGSKAKIRASKMKMLAHKYSGTNHDHSYMIANANKETALNGEYIALPATADFTLAMKDLPDDKYYIAAFNAYNGEDKLKALWLE